MPNTKSAEKAMRGSRKKRQYNLATITKYKNAVKVARKALFEKKKDDATKLLQSAYAQLDKAAKKHVIHKNKAARLKSRLALATAKMN